MPEDNKDSEAVVEAPEINPDVQESIVKQNPEMPAAKPEEEKKRTRQETRCSP